MVSSKKISSVGCSTNNVYKPESTLVDATRLPLIQAETLTPSEADTQSSGLVGRGVITWVVGTGDTRVGVGAGAVLKLPPVCMVKLVGSGVGVV